MSGLKPCPFCSGKAEISCVPGYFHTGLSSNGWLVECKKGCCNQMPYSSDHDAIESWNRRVTIEPERKGYWIRHEDAEIVDGYYVPKYECSECGSWKEDDSDFCPDCGADMRGEHE